MSPTPESPFQATILALEDHADQIKLYQKILREYRLLTATHMDVANRILEEEIPDLILLDHILAKGDRGTDILPQLRERFAHVPIIIISGTLDIKGQLDALQGPYSAHFVIEKPVDIQELRGTVKQALSECGMGEAVRSIRSLERAECIQTSMPERRFSERLGRQHELIKRFREGNTSANVSALAREFEVSRRTIARDLRDLVNRGQIDPRCCPDSPASESPEG